MPVLTPLVSLTPTPVPGEWVTVDTASGLHFGKLIRMWRDRAVVDLMAAGGHTQMVFSLSMVSPALDCLALREARHAAAERRVKEALDELRGALEEDGEVLTSHELNGILAEVQVAVQAVQATGDPDGSG